MKIFRYSFEYIFIIILFGLSKLLGYRVASEFGCFIGKTFGPFFRSKKIIQNNLIKFDNSLSSEKIINISKKMWCNYGRILAEYPHISSFRKGNLDQYIKIENKEKLEEIKSGQPVVFVSAHFSNFELMAMAIEKAGVNLSAIYRPLNNKMVNSIMEPLRKKYICKNQPVHIERYDKIYFKITFDEQIIINENADNTSISLKLNQWLESKIKKNPTQWIWTHDRWK